MPEPRDELTMPLLEEQTDVIGGPTTLALAGATVEYTYSTGGQYRMTFGAHELVFHRWDYPGAEEIGPVPYRAREIREELFLVSWLMKPGVHTAMLFDFRSAAVHTTAVVPPNQWEFFDIGEITRVDRG
ncbi:MoaF-related domain-containing protein [Kutzneria sp. NPDC052558]|uniref:MoaF-related domain-containing protein n=1 Tax=Kutzneria sp. NPDC052558 TaxID=3364121 RepID=UPI0037C9F4BB